MENLPLISLPFVDVMSSLEMFGTPTKVTGDFFSLRIAIKIPAKDKPREIELPARSC